MIITWAYDMDEDNVFDRSGIVNVEEFNPQENENLELDRFRYCLTEEGEELYEEWLDDYSLGYSLGSGRAKGLAAVYTQRKLYNILTSDPVYSWRIA